MASTISITDILSGFPHKELTKLSSEATPSAFDVRKLKKQCIQNAITVPSSLGGGNHGHVGILLTQAEYLAMTGQATAYNAPVEPAIPAYAGTAAVVQGARDQYELRQHQYLLHVAMARILKDMIIQAVPDYAIRTLHDENFGYAAVTPEQLLTHLITTYGTIDEEDMAKNIEQCKTLWDPTTTIETMFSKLAEHRHFATEGGDPISDAQALLYMVEGVEKSGVFAEALKDWRKKARARRTLDNFKLHMLHADKERCREVTAGTAGMANKATKTDDNGAKDNATKDNIPKYYCWTHGLSHNPNHTSATCTRPAEKHEKAATLANMMGGNNTIQRKRGERAVHQRPECTRGNNNSAQSANNATNSNAAGNVE